MNIIVFGASGFLGSHIAEQLSLAGHQVTCLIRESSDAGFLNGLDVAVETVDFQHESALLDFLSRANMVCNCIADTRIHARYEDKAKTEITLTRHLFKLSQKAKVKRFLQLSTVMAVGFDRPAEAIDETYVLQPVYAYSRVAADREQALKDQYAEAETQLIILRPSNAAGKRDISFLPSFILTAKLRLFPAMLGGQCRFSCIDARDVGRAMVHLLTVEVSDPEVFFVKGYDISWLQLKGRLDKKLQVKTHVFNMPKTLFMCLARLLEFIYPYGAEPALTRFSVEVLSNHLLFDDHKIRQSGFEPKYQLSDTLDDVISS
ncbi:MAG: NAD-dependent epimerase/dehydratase family protein [Pseudomonadales bacterium]|nr:NAD-dependent epimerase/dehydratase family protein [Pseudomonadales bacterium]